MNPATPALTEVRDSDMTAAPAIVRYLETHDRLQGLVTREGLVYLAPDHALRRVRKGLLDLVAAAIGAPTVIDITTLDYQRWRGAHQAKSGRERAAAKLDANRTVRYVFERAIEARASDVYIDIGRTETVLSFRIFGFKREIERFGAEEGLNLARSLWSMSPGGQFDAAQPCDCALTFDYGGHNYRIRGNCVKEIRGNAIVARIRDPAFILGLDECGYSGQQVSHIQRLCRAPGGLIVITGETNSGKSTTLAGLMAAEPAHQKMIEIADPVEVEFEHVTQIEINRYHEDAEALFRRILAALVRQNPDVLVLGEIRDALTAQAAMNMAIQGKRVYTTLHTQRCVSAIPRLANLGVDKELLAQPSFLAGIVNQNLVPVVCPHCALKAHPAPVLEGRYRQLFPQAPLRFINANGCDQCSGGISGQTLVAEVYPLHLDRDGEGHRLIAAGDFVGLDQYMQKRWHILTKHQHAASKVTAGTLDAAATERIIGEFMPADTKAERKVVGLRED